MRFSKRHAESKGRRRTFNPHIRMLGPELQKSKNDAIRDLTSVATHEVSQPHIERSNVVLDFECACKDLVCTEDRKTIRACSSKEPADRAIDRPVGEFDCGVHAVDSQLIRTF